MTSPTQVTESDFWGPVPSPLVHRATQRIARGQMEKLRPNLLWPTFDRKVNPHGVLQESIDRWVPYYCNSMGLPAGKSCPCKTRFCDGCYAVGSEQGKSVRDTVEHNLQLLLEAGDLLAMAELLSEMVSGFVYDAVRHQLPPADRIYRIHWDGDFFSELYALAWALVILAYPGINFFAYTRSFTHVNVIPCLAGIPNLSLYLSIDAENVDAARLLLPQYEDQGLMVAACAEDYLGCRKIWQRATEQCQHRRVLRCPENDKANPMHLMDDGRGACIRCQLCPGTKADIMFASRGIEDAKHGQQTFESVLLETPTVRRRKAVPPEFAAEGPESYA